jgi:hypothetical protein
MPDEDHGNSFHSGLVIAVRSAGTEAVKGASCLKPGMPAGCQAKLSSYRLAGWCRPAFFLVTTVFFRVAARCSSLQRLGGWQAFCHGWLA